MIDEKAPGCFGFAATHNPSCQVCKACEWNEPCSIKAYEALLEIQKTLDVTDILRRYASVPAVQGLKIPSGAPAERPVKATKVKINEVSPIQRALIATLPKKPQAVAEQLFKKGINIQRELNSGRNPFVEGRPAFLETPCRLLLERGSFTKSQLKREFLEKYKHWADTTAESHVSIVSALFPALGVTDVKGDLFTLRKI